MGRCETNRQLMKTFKHLAPAALLATFCIGCSEKAGSPVAVHFHATWCPTCRAQDKALDALKSDPALKNVTILKADYDQEKALKKQMNIRTQSTFVVFRGSTEVARSAGVTDAEQIKATLAAAL